MNKLPSQTGFEKNCMMCRKSKHIKYFKRHGKVCKVCNDCVPQNRVCIICKKEKVNAKFLRDSKVFQSCNDCILGLQRDIDTNFNIVFNCLTNAYRRLGGDLRKKSL